MNEVILVISFKEKLSFKLKIKEYKIQIFCLHFLLHQWNMWPFSIALVNQYLYFNSLNSQQKYK